MNLTRARCNEGSVLRRQGGRILRRSAVAPGAPSSIGLDRVGLAGLAQSDG